MKRLALTHCLTLVATVGAFALPAAQAGGAINKCVDGAGRVTLTDQACDAHTVASTVVVQGAEQDSAGPAAIQRVPMLRQARWAPALSPTLAPHAALAGDMATLKQARIQLQLQDAAPRNRIAAR